MTVTRGKGVKKSENVADVKYGSPLCNNRVCTFALHIVSQLTVERLGQLSEVYVLEPPAEAVRLFEDDDVAEPLYISPHRQTDQRMFSAR